MQVFRSDIKVGLLILTAFILLGAGIFITSDLRTLWETKKTMVFLFPYADGITKGSPVWYAGFAVGEVSTIQISNAQEARDRIAVTVRIEREARVRRDSRIDIRSLGMMGSKYIEISPGSPESPEVLPGEMFEGRAPSSLSEVIETGQQVATQLVDLIGETKALVHDVRSESSLKEVLINANGLLVDLRGRVGEVKQLLRKLDTFADSLGTIGRNLVSASGEGGKDLTALLKELRDTNRGIQKRLETVEGELVKTLGQAGKGLSEAEGTVKDVRSLVAASEQDIRSLLRNLKEASRHIEALSEDLRAHPYKVVWKDKGTADETSPKGSDQWREKGRIGPHGKE